MQTITSKSDAASPQTINEVTRAVIALPDDTSFYRDQIFIALAFDAGDKNMTPEILAKDVIADFWLKNRTYNPKWNLVTQLRNVAKSKVSNLYGRKEAKTTESFADPELKRPEQDRADDRRPAVVAETKDDFDRAIQILSQQPKVIKSPDLQLILVAMACRFWEVADLARETKLPTERIHQLKRELRDIYPTIAETLNNDGGGAQ